MTPHQFEHDGFNSPNEVEAAQRKVPAITIALQTRLNEIDSLRLQAQMLATRFQYLNQAGVFDRDEWVALRDLFSDLRKLVNRFDEVTR